ncbi:MAG: anti-sigma factor family protein, partial [Methyloceanibacter sp.]
MRMTCETIKSQLVAYRDGELSEQERGSVTAHLGTCPACTREEAQLA